MDSDTKSDQSRKQTDESLRRERIRTDEALAEQRKAAEGLTDASVKRGRERADKALDAARETADEKPGGDPLGGTGPDPLAGQRAEEDTALMHERASADDSLRREREEHARILTELLPRERERTDLYLETEREVADKALSHRDEFLGLVSHDLRNLLSGMAMRAKLIEKGAPDSDEGRRMVSDIAHIESYIARMARLIGDLVDVVGIDAGRLSLNARSGDVTALLAEAVTTYAEAARAKGISLAYALCGPVPLAVFDPERMLQVLGNLISNAMRYTPRGGLITLEAALVENEVRVSGIDTGTGIPEDMREAIFERFGQACGNDHGGLGLGLYICRSIIEAHGGRIWAEGNPAGSGTAIHFTIPVQDGASAPQQD